MTHLVEWLLPTRETLGSNPDIGYFLQPTNVLNSFMSLTQTVLQAAEMIAAYTGRIGNALKKGGVVLENAYGWMNPQPKFNRVTQTLESLQNGAREPVH